MGLPFFFLSGFEKTVQEIETRAGGSAWKYRSIIRPDAV